MTHFMDREDPPETLVQRVLRLHEAFEKASARLDTALEDLEAEETLERLRAEEYLGDRMPQLPDDAPPDTEEARRDRYLLARRIKADAQARAEREADELSNAQEAFTEAALALAKSVTAQDEKTLTRMGELNDDISTLRGEVHRLEALATPEVLSEIGQITRFLSEFRGENETLLRLDIVRKEIADLTADLRRVGQVLEARRDAPQGD